MASDSVNNLFPLAEDSTRYRKLDGDFVRATTLDGAMIVKVDPAGLTALATEAMHDGSFFLRTAHLQQVAAIIDDPEASPNDVSVALAMLKNAEVSASGVLPLCQDTGTAQVIAKKGASVWTGGGDVDALASGILATFAHDNLRYSQNAPLSMFKEKNTGTNLPAQIEIAAVDGDEYEFLFIAKGGGSANKTFLFQETPALMNPKALQDFLTTKMKTLGTAACPPYHLAVVIGGLSADMTLKTVKLATTGYLDTLPATGSERGHAFRDHELEKTLFEAACQTGIGAQFGGKYFAVDVRVIRLPRHGASFPIGMAVSCSAHRNVRAKINRDGIWIEELERNPGRFIPDRLRVRDDAGVVKIDLRRPMAEIRAELSKHPIRTRLALTGTLIVARDQAHLKLREGLERGEPLPDYIKDHPIYYAGPAKTPEGMPSGSFGPTTAGRMDAYVELFQSSGGSHVMLAKGNRSQAVTDACKKNGGFYLGSIGGPAAILAKDHIRKVELIAYPELGMEAIYRIEVEDFPAFILVDDKGNDFFRQT
ncbi:MAG: fumarate hydratase [Candidatus Hydrogenedentota bacterium]